MIALRLFAFFIFSALLTGASVAEAADEYVECPTPDKHSTVKCYYRLEITNVIGQGVFEGKVAEKTKADVKKNCKDHNSKPTEKPCGDRNDTGTYKFKIDGDTSDIKKNSDVHLENDPTSTGPINLLKRTAPAELPKKLMK